MSLTSRLLAWQTVRENIPHPDHEGVVGDLCRHAETGHFQLLVYNSVADNYDRYAVPHAWALKQVEG